MKDKVRVEIDTMQDTFTQLLQRQSHHSESLPNNEHRQADIVPPDIMEINTVNQTIITTSVLKTASTTMASKAMRSNIPTNKQKTTAKTNTATSPWLRFLAQPCTKILPSQEYLKQC